MSDSIHLPVLLEDLAAILVSGSDAEAFLQAQLTQDMLALGTERAAPAAYCTARGRVLASMVVVQADDQADPSWLMITKADVADSLVQRLRMFVLRSKVTIERSEHIVLGTAAPHIDLDSAQDAIRSSDDTTQDQQASPASADHRQAAPFTVIRHQGAVWVAAPRGRHLGTRWWGLIPTRQAPGQESSAKDISAWQADDISAGLPWVQAATQDTFIPQTLNLDLINGVSFTKGCYPGQEVVARSHYRGTIKRRSAFGMAALSASDSAMRPQELAGSDIFDANRPGNACGRVVNAAMTDTGLHMLMEVQLTDVNTADFRLESDKGPAIQIMPLPYEIANQPDR